MEAKYRTITSLEARKIVETSMKDNSYITVAQNQISNNKNQPDQLRPKRLTKVSRTAKKNYTQLKSKNPQQTPILLLKNIYKKLQIFNKNKFWEKSLRWTICPPILKINPKPKSKAKTFQPKLDLPPISRDQPTTEQKRLLISNLSSYQSREPSISRKN